MTIQQLIELLKPFGLESDVIFTLNGHYYKDLKPEHIERSISYSHPDARPEEGVVSVKIDFTEEVRDIFRGFAAGWGKE